MGIDNSMRTLALAGIVLAGCTTDPGNSEGDHDGYQDDTIPKEQDGTIQDIGDTLSTSDLRIDTETHPDGSKSLVCSLQKPNLFAEAKCPEEQTDGDSAVVFGCVDEVSTNLKRCADGGEADSAFKTCPSGEGGCAELCLDNTTGKVSDLVIFCDKEMRIPEFPVCPEGTENITICERTN